MTAPSELFVDEVVRDAIYDKMQKLFPNIGYSYTIDVPNEWQDIWCDADFPDSGKSIVRLYGKKADGVPLAEVSWTVKFEIEKDFGSRRIVADVGEVKLKRILPKEVWDRELKIQQ